MTVGLKDVARLAGVSPITVSRTLSGTHVVSPETRERVMKAVQTLGYVPNLLARGMVLQRSNTLGVVVPELANPFFVTLVDAIQTAVQDRQHLLMVGQSRRQPELEATSVRQFLQLRVAGVLTIPVAKDAPYLTGARENDTPIVVVARRDVHNDFVTVDDVLGGKLAAQHLLSLGHKRLGWVALDEPGNAALQDRLGSFLGSAREGGATLAPEARLTTRSLAMTEGEAAAERFLALSRRPTAVFCTADQLAIGFLHGLRRRGVRVPEDVSVMGYDDIAYAAFLDVPLTTIALPLAEIGRRAVDVLFARITQTGKRPREQAALAPRLVVRASCAPRT